MSQKPIPLLDLRAQHAEIREEVLAAVLRVVESQQFILGAEVEKLETAIAAYCGSRWAVGCASGSDALRLSLLALGIGPGVEVVTTPFTFFATAGSIWHCGARPVFVDVEAETFNIDAGQAVDALSKRPQVRAVMPVHLFGACADLDPLVAAARERGVAVVEDAAQSIGAEYKGRRAGSIGDTGCFSFFPSKNLGGYGDGGIITTDDERLAVRLRSLRVHGASQRYYHDEVGINSRLDALQAAVLQVKLRRLDVWTEKRQRNAELYRRYFKERGVPVIPPAPAPYATRHVYNQFTIRCERRDELREFLAGRGIGTEIYYPLPLHLQKCFTDLGYRRGDFPVSERLAEECLSLPLQPELTPDDLARVVDSIADFYAGSARP